MSGCINRKFGENLLFPCYSLRHLLTQMTPPSSEGGFFPEGFH